MAHANKRTSVLLGALALVFLIIIIVLVIAPQSGSPAGGTLIGDKKTKTNVTGVLTDAPTTTTTTTPSPTTTRATQPSPTPSEATSTTPPTTTTATQSTPSPSTTPITTTADTTTTTSTDDDTTTTSTTTTTTSTDDDTTTTTSTDDDTTTTSTDTTTTTTTTTSTDDETTTTTTTDNDTTTITDDYDSTTDNDTTTTSTDDDTTTTTSTDDDTTITTTSTDDDTTTTTTSTDDDTTTTTTSTDDDTTTITDDYDSISTDNDTTTTTTISTDEDTTTTTTDDDTTTTITTTDLPESSTTTTTLSTTVQPTTIPTSAAPTTTSEPSTTVTPPLTTASPECQAESEQKQCHAPACKTLASNMLAMMDHSEDVDRCQDFYQYACGGLMENPFLHARDPQVIAEKLMQGGLDTTDQDETTPLGKMRIFYDSCLGAVNQDVSEGWMLATKKVFGEDCFDRVANTDPLDLTTVMTKMMQHDFAPFVDVTLDLHQDDKSLFAIILSPTLPGSPFSKDLAQRVCLEEHEKRLENLENGDTYVVNDEYNEFIKCVRSGSGLTARLERMEEAMRAFGFLDLVDPATKDTVLEDIKGMTRNLLLRLAEVAPSVAVLKQDLRNKDFSSHGDVGELEDQIIDWKTLVSELIPANDISNMKQYIYQGDAWQDILNVLKEHNDDSSTALGGVLLMLWSERLYTDFVKPIGSSVGEPEYCLRAAVTLMPDAAALLYMNALPEEERDARQTQIENITSSIKRAGMKVFQQRGRDTEEAQEKLWKMLDHVKTAATNDVADAADESLGEIAITSSSTFFDNCIELLANRRRVLYSMNEKYPETVPQMFMQPYDPFGVYVYYQNRIMVPYAAQDDQETFADLPKYLSYAGLGHMISHLVMHGYDTTGVSYQSDGKRKVLSDYKHYTSLTDELMKQYQAAQSYVNRSSHGITAMTQMSSLAKNELVADSGAVRLAWQAYIMRNEPDPTNPPETYPTATAVFNRRRRHSPRDLTRRTIREAPVHLTSLESEEKLLPWLGLSPAQLYFLHWSQRYCSATGGEGLLELTESLQPPARMKVNLVLKNEPLFSEAFGCPPMAEATPFVLG